MELFSELFVYSDQPVTCPYCGASSEVILDMQHSRDVTQVHKCMNQNCLREFVMIYDVDFDYFHKEPDKQYLFSERDD
jgi:hypothetical protein